MKHRSLERLGADSLLLLAAILWGGGFVAQRVASTALGFFAYNGLRFVLAGILLIPLCVKYLKGIGRNALWILPAGVLLFAGSALQQAGVETTTAGAAGFITGIYVVLVPLFLSLFWKVKNPCRWWERTCSAPAARVFHHRAVTCSYSSAPCCGLSMLSSWVWRSSISMSSSFRWDSSCSVVCSIWAVLSSSILQPCPPSRPYGRQSSTAGFSLWQAVSPCRQSGSARLPRQTLL